MYDGIDKLTEVQPILDGAIDMIAQNPLLEVSDILEILQDVHGCQLSFKSPIHLEMTELAIRYEAMTLCRKETLEQVADLGLRLYGETNWKKILGDDVEYMSNLCNWELPKLYNTSKINLNMTNATILEGFPMRVFEVPGFGGFLLTDYRPMLGEFFEIGKEVVCYMDIEDLRGKIKYYLAHPDERKEIARRGQERVLKEHTYRHRMQKLIDTMREIFG